MLTHIKNFLHIENSKKMNKGIAFVFGAVIVTFLILIAILMPFLALKVHIERNVIFETKYNNVQLSLLSLLSTKYTDSLDGTSKPVYEILSEHMSLKNKPDITFLNSLLNDLTENHVYELYYTENGQNQTLAKQGDPSKFETSTMIVIPYNSSQLYKELHLVID
jgi:hypothetical protein